MSSIKSMIGHRIGAAGAVEAAALALTLQTGVMPSQPSGTLTYSGSLATAAAPAGGAAPVLVGKRGKSQEEIEEQTERIKKRRRESAQRRCAVEPCVAAGCTRRF